VEKLDAVVVGGGVVGLAVARALAQSGREVVILEAEDAIGTPHQLAQLRGDPRRYLLPEGLAESALLRRRQELLYEYCVAHGVPHRRSGKLIVATSQEQVGELENIQKKRTPTA
jgi:L-2-hydroxyglutarate oxidase LhgO